MSIPKIIAAQRAYFNSNITKSLDFRLDNLRKLKKIVTENQQKLFNALYQDLKKSDVESYTSEYALILDEINFAIKNLHSWAKVQKIPTPLSLKPASAEIRAEPYGVTLIIAPWNYPFQLALAPIVGAMAAGNTVILKPSELSTHTEKLLVEMINSNFDSKYLCVIAGGKEVSQELLKEKFDFILFTGSTAVGKIVMKAAAEHLTPVCLELGGKSPCIIDETADLEVAARRVVWGKFFNAGQTCVAPDYLYLQESIKSQFLALLKKNILNFYGENELKSKDFGKIISKPHFDRLVSLIEGSKILYGGEKNREEQFISPTLLEVGSWNEAVMQEEVFGPVLPVLSYKNLDEVIETIKAKDRPLATYIFSRDKKNIDKVLTEISFGGGCVNDCLLQFSMSELPVGGIGASGMGKYHGKASFETFSHQKGIVKKSNFMDLDMRYPPYTEEKYNIIKRLI